MSTISSAGIGSGLDVESIVGALMAIEARPKNQLAKARTELDSQVSAVGKLKSLTSAVRDAASRLSTPGIWDQTASTSANEDAVKVTSKDGAAPGALSVAVTALAQGQTLASTAFGSSSATVGQGSLTITLGSWDENATAFTAKSGATPVTITIGPEDTSLSKIRDRINEANAGVSASLITDATGTRLALRSRATGEENGFRVTASGGGLSALTYDPPGGASQMTRTQAAANAQATINGIEVESASNTLDGVVDGVTLQLRRITQEDVEIGIEPDPAVIREQVDAFVKSFNELMAYIKAQTAYDPTTKVAGALQGDSLATSLQRQFRTALNQPSSASSEYSRLADVGITMQANGSLAVNKTKLDAAIENRDELEKLFRADGATSGEDGFLVRFRQLGDALLGSDGLFETRDSSLKARIERNTRSQADIDRRLEATEERLRARYQALDTNMGRLSGLQNYVSQQMALLMRNSG